MTGQPLAQEPLPVETLWIGFSLIIRSSSTNVVGGNCSDRASGGRPSTLAVENTKPRQFAPPALICENQFVSITKGRTILPLLLKSMKFIANFKAIFTY